MTAFTSSPSLAKLADRMLGAIRNWRMVAVQGMSQARLYRRSTVSAITTVYDLHNIDYTARRQPRSSAIKIVIPAFAEMTNFEVVWLNNRSVLPEAAWRVPLSQACLKSLTPSCSQPNCLFGILHLRARRLRAVAPIPRQQHASRNENIQRPIQRAMAE